MPTPIVDTKSNQDTTLTLFIVLSAISIIIPILVYVFNMGSWSFSKKKEEWDLFSAFIGGTLSPIVGVLSLLISGYIVYKFNKIQHKYQEDKDNGQLQQVTIDLFKEFRSEQMSKARSNAWQMKQKWYEADESSRDRFRKMLVIAMVSEKTVNNAGICIERQHLRAVNDMISFYTMLSLYSKNSKNITELNYFYYPWWRGFLKELTNECDKKTKECLNSDEQLAVPNFNKGEYFDNLSHISAFIRLDKICGFEDLTNFDMMCEPGKLMFPS
ncbi:hypothetical protein OQ267_11135 [Pedobacter sp. MR22-3]|nr:hypothetical protein [Pedobacter sp. MR22-3]